MFRFFPTKVELFFSLMKNQRIKKRVTCPLAFLLTFLFFCNDDDVNEKRSVLVLKAVVMMMRNVEWSDEAQCEILSPNDGKRHSKKRSFASL